MNTQTTNPATVDQTGPQVRPLPAWLEAMKGGRRMTYGELRASIDAEAATDPVHAGILLARALGLGIQYEPETATYRLAGGDR